MNYTKPSFSVPASGENKLPCAHGWVAKNRCVLCGAAVQATPYEHETSAASFGMAEFEAQYGRRIR